LEDSTPHAQLRFTGNCWLCIAPETFAMSETQVGRFCLSQRYYGLHSSSGILPQPVGLHLKFGPIVTEKLESIYFPESKSSRDCVSLEKRAPGHDINFHSFDISGSLPEMKCISRTKIQSNLSMNLKICFN